LSEIIKSNNNYYDVGIIAKIIIQKFNVGKSSLIISEEINKEFGTNFFDEKKIDDFITKNLVNQKIASTTIRFKINIFYPSKHINIFKKCSDILLNKYFVYIIVLIFTLFLINYISIGLILNQVENIQIIDYFLIYCFVFIIMFVHEIGHTISAIKYNIIPKSIGFGIYFIFPVLYTDLTKIWKLKTNEKIIINLSGIYFQIIIEVILFIIKSIIVKNEILDYLIISNLILMLNAFNPFFKYDGYWIYSDYFKIKNLRKKSNNYIRTIFNKKNENTSLSLKIYSYLSIIFVFLQIYGLFYFTKINISKIIFYKHENEFLITINVILNLIFIFILLVKIQKTIKK
jgi:putative peptide zinc metalloprotease protein